MIFKCFFDVFRLKQLKDHFAISTAKATLYLTTNSSIMTNTIHKIKNVEIQHKS